MDHPIPERSPNAWLWQVSSSWLELFSLEFALCNKWSDDAFQSGDVASRQSWDKLSSNESIWNQISSIEFNSIRLAEISWTQLNSAMWIKLNSIESIGTSINSVEVSLVQWCKFAMPPAWNATLDSIWLIPLLDYLPDGVDYALPLQCQSTPLGKLSNSSLKLFSLHWAWMFCFTPRPQWMESTILIARSKI